MIGSAITRNGMTFSFFWDDFMAIGNVQTTTITCISGDKTVSADFDLEFETPCNDPNLTTITATPQTDPPSDNYSGANLIFQYNPFTVSPVECSLDVMCLNVDPNIGVNLPCQELDQN